MTLITRLPIKSDFWRFSLVIIGAAAKSDTVYDYYDSNCLLFFSLEPAVPHALILYKTHPLPIGHLQRYQSFVQRCVTETYAIIDLFIDINTIARVIPRKISHDLLFCNTLKITGNKFYVERIMHTFFIRFVKYYLLCNTASTRNTNATALEPFQ